jgi:hypothetical protein
MSRLLLIVILSVLWGAAYGYFVVGRWRLDLQLGEGILGSIVWRVLLQSAGVFGPIVLFAAAGFYPVRAVEVIVSFGLAFLCAVAFERAYQRQVSRTARRAGLLGEEDL